jgi:hypothetical protein
VQEMARRQVRTYQSGVPTGMCTSGRTRDIHRRQLSRPDVALTSILGPANQFGVGMREISSTMMTSTGILRGSSLRPSLSSDATIELCPRGSDAVLAGPAPGSALAPAGFVPAPPLKFII